MRKRTVYPPSSPPPEELLIIREHFQKKLLIWLPWGDSYKLSVDEVRTYLKMLGDPFPDVAVDRVWSFFAVHYNPTTCESYIVPLEDAKEIMSREVPELAGVS